MYEHEFVSETNRTSHTTVLSLSDLTDQRHNLKWRHNDNVKWINFMASDRLSMVWDASKSLCIDSEKRFRKII